MSEKITLWNGNILTIDSKDRRAEAVAMADGKIARVGTNQEVRRFCGDGWKSIDLQGKTVLPGFIDSHVHLNGTAMTPIGVDLSEVRSIEDILVRVRERVKETAMGEWIFGYFITHLPDRGIDRKSVV